MKYFIVCISLDTREAVTYLLSLLKMAVLAKKSKEPPFSPMSIVLWLL
jgi:hypothetical protein